VEIPITEPRIDTCANHVADDATATGPKPTTISGDVELTSLDFGASRRTFTIKARPGKGHAAGRRPDYESKGSWYWIIWRAILAEGALDALRRALSKLNVQ
jgi:hypothetical protein